MEEVCATLEYRPTFWERIQKLLGYGDCRQPDFDGDPYAVDYSESHLSSVTLAHLDFADRLRMLISGRIIVRVSIKTDKVIERSYSKSNVAIAPIGYKP